MLKSLTRPILAGHDVSVLDDPAAFFADHALQAPYPLYRRLREAGPVHRVGDSGFHLVCSWAAVDDAIKRPRVFSSNLTATMTYRDGRVVPFELDGLGGPTHALATADDPSHALHRRLLVPHLAARRLAALERLIADTFDRLWELGCSNGRIEWMGALANRLPMIVVARLIGVPDTDVDVLIRWAGASTQMLDGLIDEDGLAASGAAAMQLGAYIAGHFATALAEPRDNLLGAVATACAAGELDPLTAQMMIIILFGAGGESTGSLLGTALWILASRPDVWRALRDNPALIPDFIEEVLRFEPPFRGHYRHVVDDTDLCGVDLAAGSRLLLLWGAANRDPGHFAVPDEFRLQRPGAKSHLSFGRGAHFCVGAALARLEARIVLRRLLARVRTVEATDVGPWLPSILIRRREYLHLTVG